VAVLYAVVVIVVVVVVVVVAVIAVTMYEYTIKEVSSLEYTKIP
jgi:hypothetical protein